MTRRHRLSNDIENRLADYIYEMEQAEMSLSTFAVLTYVQGRDFSFRRMRKQQLEKSIERVLQAIKKSKQEQPSDVHNEQRLGEDDDTGEDEIDNLESLQLMEVQDTNAMNRSVMNLWNLHRGAQDTSKSTNGDAPSTPKLADPAEVSKTEVPEEASKSQSTTRSKRKVGHSNAPESKRHKASTDDLIPTISNARFSHLAGIESCLKQIMESIVQPFVFAPLYGHLGLHPPRGVLLHGPPGTGKTMLAQAIAGELDVPYFNISAPSIVSGMSGESEKKIREIFDAAKNCAPCLIFIDEIDAITPKRESAQREMERRIVAQLLTCIDDLSLEKTNNKPVMIIGATNRPDSLDPALRRAGRFDREISVGIPDETSREKILRLLTAKLRLSEDIDFTALAKLTAGYVGADLNSLARTAGDLAISRIFHDFISEALRKEAATVNSESQPSDTTMQIDEATTSAALTSTASAEIVTAFIRENPQFLTFERLSMLMITREDFDVALKQVQPSSKREGFATVPDVTWSDVGALNKVRRALETSIVYPIRYPELYEKVGITDASGVLLWGPPGCGKTLLAKAVANQSRANFISVKGPELLNKYVGESERAVRQVFNRARDSAPCVIFFDELDALCARRDDSQSEASARVVNTLLTELDGMENRKKVYVVAATNRPDIIDPAMTRPGRLDKLLYVELPTIADRIEILRALTRKKPLDNSCSLEAIANDPRCEGFSGADLAALVREAALAAIKGPLYSSPEGVNPETLLGDLYITPEHFDAALSVLKPSVSAEEKRKYDALSKKYGQGT
ncbi:uncharacterized protein VTP21DRAFT_1709 [Calcarisporiella thermophila]|uniref:uncharacterized protein n=1 Tax=Calcarisporiella thermophila TaxID=911321 RepID=UPI003744269B